VSIYIGLSIYSIAENNIIDWNENQFYDVSNETHYKETHCASLEDLSIFSLVWSSAFVEKV